MSLESNRMKTETQEHPYGKAVATLIEEFGHLPGIGRKSAERLANHILSCTVAEANALARALGKPITLSLHLVPSHALFCTPQGQAQTTSEPDTAARQVLCTQVYAYSLMHTAV